MISPEKSAKGPSLTRTVSPISHWERGLARWATSSGVSVDTDRKLSTSRRGSGEGLAPWPTKPVTPGVLRMTYQLSSSSARRTSREPGNIFFWTTTFLPALNSTTSSMGMTTSWIRSSMFMEEVRASRFCLTFFS